MNDDDKATDTLGININTSRKHDSNDKSNKVMNINDDDRACNDAWRARVLTHLQPTLLAIFLKLHFT